MYESAPTDSYIPNIKKKFYYLSEIKKWFLSLIRIIHSGLIKCIVSHFVKLSLMGINFHKPHKSFFLNFEISLLTFQIKVYTLKIAYTAKGITIENK